MFRTLTGFAVAALLIAVPVGIVRAQAADAKAAFDKAMAEVTKTQTNSAAEATAMEKAIAAARALKPSPAVPDATIDHVGRAKAAVRVAKSPRDFLDAANAFGEAARIAPWVADYHFNRGVLLEKAEKYGEAERALGLYLKAAPDAKDKNEVRERIAGLRYLKEKAARPPQSSSQSAAVPAATSGPRVTPGSLSGLWMVDVGKATRGEFDRIVYQLDSQGSNRMILRWLRRETKNPPEWSGSHEISLTLAGLNFEGVMTWPNNVSERVTGTVTADGRSMILRRATGLVSIVERYR